MLPPETTSNLIDIPSYDPGLREPGVVPWPTFVLEFTDNQGIRWQRQPDGDLSEVSENRGGFWHRFFSNR